MNKSSPPSHPTPSQFGSLLICTLPQLVVSAHFIYFPKQGCSSLIRITCVRFHYRPFRSVSFPVHSASILIIDARLLSPLLRFLYCPIMTLPIQFESPNSPPVCSTPSLILSGPLRFRSSGSDPRSSMSGLLSSMRFCS